VPAGLAQHMWRHRANSGVLTSVRMRSANTLGPAIILSVKVIMLICQKWYVLWLSLILSLFMASGMNIIVQSVKVIAWFQILMYLRKYYSEQEMLYVSVFGICDQFWKLKHSPGCRKFVGWFSDRELVQFFDCHLYWWVHLFFSSFDGSSLFY